MGRMVTRASRDALAEPCTFASLALSIISAAAGADGGASRDQQSAEVPAVATAIESLVHTYQLSILQARVAVVLPLAPVSTPEHVDDVMVSFGLAVESIHMAISQRRGHLALRGAALA